MGILTIRAAEPKDVHEMAQLDKICFSAPWSEDSFWSEINTNERAVYIVAELENRIVGYGGMWIILDEGHITNIAVHPDYRRKHIGHAIVETIIETAENNGVVAETLEVRKSNTPAINLYTGFKFREEGVREGYYDDNGEDAIIMWRRI